MTDYVLEGGPEDGRVLTVADGTHIVRIPQRQPVSAAGRPILTVEVVEYVKSGRVYRWDGMIGDAQAEMGIAEEVFRDPRARRYARAELRRQLEHLAPTKELGRVVWVVGREPHRFLYHLVAFVGGHRAEYASQRRAELRRG